MNGNVCLVIVPNFDNRSLGDNLLGCVGKVVSNRELRLEAWNLG